MTRFSALRRTPALLLLSGLVIAAIPASQAQTPAKPTPKTTAKPAATTPATATGAEGKTATLGGGTGRGKLLMIEELRECINQQANLAGRRKAFEAETVAINSDRETLLADQDKLKADAVKVEETRKAISDLNARYNAYAERMKSYNERAEEARNKQGMGAERERRKLEADRAELEAQTPALTAERAALAATEKFLTDYNQRAAALDARAKVWNQVNVAAIARGNKLNEEMETWQSECANRRFREEDELAVKRGL